jgi:hypothetical protein
MIALQQLSELVHRPRRTEIAIGGEGELALLKLVVRQDVAIAGAAGLAIFLLPEVGEWGRVGAWVCLLAF